MITIRPWVLAARPKTWTASLTPVLVSTALAFRVLGSVHWEISLFSFFAALFIQIGTNFVNDALDFEKGADTDERLGPIRATQAGYLTARQVLVGGVVCFCLALLFATPLIHIGGGWIGLILILSILSGYLYTGGSYPLAYTGLGDLFVLVFFGFVASGAVFVLQGASLDSRPLLAGAQIGLLTTGILVVNNLRDMKTDAKAGKRTLPVRFGLFTGKVELTLVTFLPFVLNLLWIAQGYLLAGIAPFFSLPFACILAYKIWRCEPGAVYNRFLGLAALLLQFFGFLLAAGLILE